MTAPVDPKLATAASAQHELTQRKLEMDALRKRLRSDPSKEQKLREACEGFESIFVQKMWEQMRATLPKEGYLHSKEEEMWQSMYDQELAKKMTSAGGIGLADMIYEQLSTRLSDASRTTAPSSVREPVPVKPVSMMPRVVTPSADGVKGGAPVKGSSMYEPASPEAPVVSDAAQAHGDAPAVEGGVSGHDLVRRHLAELEREVSAAPEAASPAAGATAAGAAGAAPGASPVAPNASNSPSTPNSTYPMDATGGAQAVAAPQRRASRSGKDAPTRGLPAASVAGETTRKVRSPMRDAQLGPPIVHRTGAMKRVASPAATRALTVPAGAPLAAELQSAASGSPAQGAGNTAGSAPEGAAGVTVSSPSSGVTPGVTPGAATGSPGGASSATSSSATSSPASPASSVSGVKSSPTGGPAVASGAPGPMAWPHEGRIASGFGWRNDPLTGERAWHPGVDIAVAEGDPVRAAWDGKVVFAGERADYGKLVVLEHPGGWRSFYGHNGSLDVREGDAVRAGTEIAKAGGTGRVAGPHLHFEVRQGELAVNPEYAARSLASGGPSARLTRPGG